MITRFLNIPLCSLIILLVLLSQNTSPAVSADILTREERTWFEENKKKLTFSAELGFPPISFIKKGERTGFSNNYVLLLEEKLNLKFTFKTPDYFPILLTSIKKGELAFLANIHKNEVREKLLDFSDPYIEVPTVYITKSNVQKRNFKNTKSLIISVVQKAASHDFLLTSRPHLMPVPQKNTLDCLLQVSTGLTDAALVSLPAALHLIEDKKITGLKIAQYSDLKYKLRFAVRKDLPELISILNKGIEAVEKEEYELLYNKWIEPDMGPIHTNKKFLSGLAGIAVLASLFFFIVFFWNIRLRTAVQKKTKEFKDQQLQLNKKINKRKSTQKKLIEEERHLKSVLDTLPDMVWVKDPEGQYMFCNNKYENFYGHAEKELIGQTDYNYFVNEKAEQIDKADHQVLKNMAPLVEEQQIISAINGKKTILEAIKVPVSTSDGDLLGILGVGRDISDIKKLETELIEFYKRLETILKNIDGFTYRIKNNADLTLEFISGHVLSLTGKSPEQLINTPRNVWGEIVVTEDQELFHKNFEEMASSKQPGEHQGRLKHIDGKVSWILNKSFLVLDDNGEVSHIDGLVINISEKKQLEDRLAQTGHLEAIGILAGGIAHDFNNLLTGILGFGELLRDDLQNAESSDEMIHAVNGVIHGGTKVQELVAQLLTFTRMKTEDKSTLNTGMVINKVVNLLEASLPKNINIKTTIQSDSAIQIVPDQLHQLVLKLCADIIRTFYSQNVDLCILLKDEEIASELPEESMISSGTYQHLSIMAKSKETPLSYSDRSLDVFFQSVIEEGGDKSRITQELITSVGGYMTSSSSEKEQRIDIFFPVFQENGTLLETSSNEAIYPNTGNILLVDKEESISSLMKYFLQDNNFNVQSYTNRIDAMAELKRAECKYDLVIATKREETVFFQARSIKPSIRTLLLLDAAGSIEENDKIVDAVLKKPFTMTEFTTTITQLFKG